MLNMTRYGNALGLLGLVTHYRQVNVNGPAIVVLRPLFGSSNSEVGPRSISVRSAASPWRMNRPALASFRSVKVSARAHRAHEPDRDGDQPDDSP